MRSVKTKETIRLSNDIFRSSMDACPMYKPSVNMSSVRIRTT